MKLFSKCTAAALAAALCLTMGSVAFCDVKEVELKLLVTESVVADRAVGYKTLWESISKTAADDGFEVKADEELGKDKARVTRYLDTDGMDLTKHKYILRQRVKMKKGKLEDKSNLTLKLRLPEGAKEFDEKFARELGKKAEVKFEADKVGFAGGVPGKIDASWSVSATYKNVPVNASGTTMAEFATVFPVLATLGVDMSKPVVWTPAREVLEYTSVLGEIKLPGHDESEIETSVWYNLETKKYIVAEISWSYKTKDAENAQAMEKLFLKLQNAHPNMFAKGQSKTSIVISE